MRNASLAALFLFATPAVAQTPTADAPATAPQAVRIQIVRVSAGRDLFPLAFPMPSRVNGVFDELAVLLRNAAKDHLEITVTRYAPVTVAEGRPAIIVTGHETPDAPTKARSHVPVYRNRIVATPHFNADGTVSAKCRVIETTTDPLFGAVDGVPPTYRTDSVSGLRSHSGDTDLVESGGGGDRPSHTFYATVTVLPTGAG